MKIKEQMLHRIRATGKSESTFKTYWHWCYQLVTEVEPLQNAVYYTVGSRRYMANRLLVVLEVADGKMFSSNHSLYQQGLLRGGVRDDSGTLTTPVKDFH